MSQSVLCQLCWADVETGEVYCLRLGEWVAKCPYLDGGDPWGAERAAADEYADEDGDEADGEGGRL